MNDVVLVDDGPSIQSQNVYFPAAIPKTIFQFEKMDIAQYVTSRFRSMRPMNWIRLFLTVFYACVIAVSILHYKVYIKVDFYYAQPVFVIPIMMFLFFTSLLVITIKYRTLMKQLYEYNARFEPIPITFPMKLVHLLYTLLLTLPVVYFTLDLTYLRYHGVKYTNMNMNHDLAIKLAIILPIWVECLMNNIRLVPSHALCVYMFTGVYFSLVTFFRLHFNYLTLFPEWFVAYHPDDDKLSTPFLWTLCLYFLVTNAAAISYIILQKCLRCCKPREDKTRKFRADAVYFFNTSDVGTTLALSLRDYQGSYGMAESEGV